MKTIMSLAGGAIVPEIYNRHFIKVHPKYLFSLAGFGIGSVISFIIIIAEEFNEEASATMGHSQLHHLVIPVIFGLLGMVVGYIYGKKRQTKKEAYQEIFDNQQTMSLILDHLPVLISYLDTDLRYRYANKTYEKWMGLSMQDIYGKPVKDILSEKTFDLILLNLPKLAEGEIISFETLREIKGEERFINSDMVPHFGPDKKIKGFFTIVTDITKLKKRQIKIKKQKDKLEELNATKDKFFSIIAHDLKNPLNSVLGFSELLHQDYEIMEELQKRQFIDLIYEIVQNTYNLLENLLEWAHSQSDAIKYSPSVTNIKTLVDENLNLLQSLAGKKNIHLKSNVSESLTINTDPDLIKAVIRNLFSNAIKFTPENGEVSASAVLISGADGNGTLEISVADTGVGISPENMKKLFVINKNYSSKGTNGELGTGLGLILCKEFVEKCGGEIWVESEVGNGSTFHFTLPNNNPLDNNNSF